MAAGRGEFFRSFLEGLERIPGQSSPCRQPRDTPVAGRGRGTPGTAGGKSGPGKRKKGGQRRKNRLKEMPSSVSGNSYSCPEPRSEDKKTDFNNKNLMERLPYEILLKILSYLDASSLSCISHVSKLFYRLSNDDVMWQRIYMSEFENQTWKLKLWSGDVATKDDPAAVEGRSTGHWKRMYFRTMAGKEMKMWSREMKDVSPYTGLPKQTEWVLRSLNVSWELTVSDFGGHEITVKQSRVFFFESSVIVRWNGGMLPKYHKIKNIQLFGVRQDTLKSRPGWRSLIVEMDKRGPRAYCIGKDKLIKLMHLQPGFVVGVWRGQDGVAFIMVSLHFHRLVERSLLGSPVCPYSEPDVSPLMDNSDPEFGLHDYTLHIVLHNTGTEIMSGHFRQLSCNTAHVQRGLLEMRVISRTNLSQHRSLSGNITLPWTSEELQGSVEKCCIITLTLLDELQKPFWCFSSPTVITPAKKRLSFDYGGEHFVMNFYNSDGKVKLELVWLKEQRQFFIISLTVFISVFKVNKHFSTVY